MNYVFFGSPRFASLILDELCHRGHPPQAVIANPDRPAGRKKLLASPPIKLVADTYRLPLHQPVTLPDFNFKTLAKQADLFVVAAYAKIIPANILDLPRFGTIGIHPSLLPLFRGATPIQSAILEGSSKTGVTVYKMDAEVDHGPILSSAPLGGYEPDTQNYLELEAGLARLGAKLFLETMPPYLTGHLTPQSQDNSKATLTKKFTAEDALVEEGELTAALKGDADAVRSAHRKILAFVKEPGAWTYLHAPLSLDTHTLPPHTRIKLLESNIRNKRLVIRAFQVAGKKPQII